MKSLVKPLLQIAVPRWSPDGKTIAFIGGLMSDESVIGGDVFTIAADGGEARNITPQMKLSASLGDLDGLGTAAAFRGECGWRERPSHS